MLIYYIYTFNNKLIYVFNLIYTFIFDVLCSYLEYMYYRFIIDWILYIYIYDFNCKKKKEMVKTANK